MSDAPTFSRDNPDPNEQGEAATGSTAGSIRHVLEFEKPLAVIERQIQELEALQHQKQADYAMESRRLRNKVHHTLLR